MGLVLKNTIYSQERRAFLLIINLLRKLKKLDNLRKIRVYLETLKRIQTNFIENALNMICNTQN